MKNVFEKIIDREIEADIRWEDEHALVFTDISPVAPIHLLVLPKKRIRSLQDAGKEDKELLAHLLILCQEMATREKIADQGYRVITNVREYGGQTVEHLHFHLIGGRMLGWPPG